MDMIREKPLSGFSTGMESVFSGTKRVLTRLVSKKPRRQLLLPNDLCKKIIVQYLDGEFTLATICKRFELVRREVSFFFHYEKLCAMGTPPKYDPFRKLIKEAIVGHIRQQVLWKQLWILREQGMEPWIDIEHYRHISGITIYAGFTLHSSLSLGCHVSDWKGRSFQNCTFQESEHRFDGHCYIYESGLGRRVATISVKNARSKKYKWVGKSGFNAIAMMDDERFRIWVPDIDSLVASALAASVPVN